MVIELLCNSVQAEEIDKLYSFTYRDFVKLTGKFDVYALGELAKMSSVIEQCNPIWIWRWLIGMRR